MSRTILELIEEGVFKHYSIDESGQRLYDPMGNEKIMLRLEGRYYSGSSIAAELLKIRQQQMRDDAKRVVDAVKSRKVSPRRVRSGSRSHGDRLGLKGECFTTKPHKIKG